MVERSPTEQAEVNAAMRAEEEGFTELFQAMDDERFVLQGVSIFRAAAEDLPTVNPAADAALSGLIQTLIEGKAPVPGIFGASRTATAWRMYTAELVRRVAENRHANFSALAESRPRD